MPSCDENPKSAGDRLTHDSILRTQVTRDSLLLPHPHLQQQQYIRSTKTKMIGYGRGGGGGGFGGFPYRSSHQQGQDGRGGNNRGGRGRGRGGGRQHRKQSRPRSQNTNLISIAAELNIPPEHRRVIVGRRGTTLKWLKEVSGVNIFVPHVQKNNRRGRSTQQEADMDADTDPDGTASAQEQVNQHPVRVNSSELSSILHAFDEISRLLSDTSDIDADFIPCIVKMRTNGITTPVDGKLYLHRDVADETSRGRCLFSGSIRTDPTNNLHAYSIGTTAFDEESVSMLVDNILFVDSSLERCHWYYKKTPCRNCARNSSSTINSDDDDDNVQNFRQIVFLFGSGRDNCDVFFEKMKNEICAAENNASSSR